MSSRYENLDTGVMDNENQEADDIINSFSEGLDDATVDTTQTETTQEVVETVPEPTETVAQTASESEQSDANQHTVPVSVLVAARREAQFKQQQLERELEAQRQRVAQFEASQKQSTFPDPVVATPEELQEAIQQQINTGVQNAIVEQNRAMLGNSYVQKVHSLVQEGVPVEHVLEAGKWAEWYAQHNPEWGEQALATQADLPRFFLAERQRHAQEQAEWEAFRQQRAAALANPTPLSTSGAMVAPTTQMAQPARATHSVNSMGNGRVSKPNTRTDSEEADAIINNLR